MKNPTSPELRFGVEEFLVVSGAVPETARQERAKRSGDLESEENPGSPRAFVATSFGTTSWARSGRDVVRGTEREVGGTTSAVGGTRPWILGLVQLGVPGREVGGTTAGIEGPMQLEVPGVKLEVLACSYKPRFVHSEVPAVHLGGSLREVRGTGFRAKCLKRKQKKCGYLKPLDIT
jgi:hypothetical protein